MSRLVSNRTLLLVLTGTGLVLVGLLAGILLTLNWDAEESGASAEAVPVQLQEPAIATAPALDSLREALPPDLRRLNDLFREAAGEVTSTVVFIEVDVAGSEEEEWFNSFRQRRPRQSVGSGVILSEDGYIITNEHVVQGAERITVLLDDKRQFDARIVGADPSTDLAVLQVETNQPLPAATLGNSDLVEVGEWVIAVGNPFRLTSTVTAGIVSALGRQVNIIEDAARIEDFIQTDAAINPGNSGGALVNLSGELVGINTAIATQSGSSEGYGFAVPMNLAQRVAADLIAYGEVRRGLLGVEIQDLNAEAADLLGLDRVAGVYIERVQRGGAADEAGIQRGDVLLGVGPLPVDATNELQSAIARYRPGDPVALTVYRDGQRLSLEVVLKDRNDPVYSSWLGQENPEPPPNPEAEVRPEQPDAVNPEQELTNVDAWGLGVRTITSREQEAFDLEEGVYLAYVEHGSTAHQAGVPRDLVVTSVNGEAVETAAALQQYLSTRVGTEAPVLLEVRRRNGLTAFYEMTPPRD